MINRSLCSLLAIGLTATNTVYAHLPAYEGERVRHDNHFTKEGFASPVRGECDITAAGPTDDNAGFANIYLGGLSKHYNYNDIFFLHEDTSVQLYLMWWMDNHKHDHYRWFDDDYDWPHKRRKHRNLIDASITTGVVDQFIVGDYINIGITGPFSANSRYIHGSCNDPRQTGKVDMTIETNN